jgi:hypothetical protein
MATISPVVFCCREVREGGGRRDGGEEEGGEKRDNVEGGMKGQERDRRKEGTRDGQRSGTFPLSTTEKAPFPNSSPNSYS